MKQTRILCICGCLALSAACSGSSSGPAASADDVAGDAGPDAPQDTTGDVAPDAPDLPDAADASPDEGPDSTDAPDAPDTGCGQGQMRCDGECVDVLSSEAHCGGCAPCAEVTNAAVSCVVGVCAFACDDSWADADSDPANGCECAVVPDAVEICDGVDNNCNGEVDEEILRIACGGVPNTLPRECLGEEGCTYLCGGNYVDANNDLDLAPAGDGCECLPEREICDGIDNDCDGLIDTDDPDWRACPGMFFATSVCEDGACIYACADTHADQNNDLGDPDGNGCECPLLREVCDGVDNDCDGLVDAEDPDMVHDCERRFGVCAGLMQQCIEGELLACTPEDYTEYAESNNDLYQAGQETYCDGMDNDCDNRVDDGCCPATRWQQLGTMPRGGEVRPVIAASDSPNNWLVAWQDTQADELYGRPPREGQVKWRRTFFLGLPIGDPVGTASEGSISPAIVWNGAGWTVYTAVGGTIRWRTLGAEGALERQATVHTNAAAVFDELDAASVGDGRSLVVFQTNRLTDIMIPCQGTYCVELLMVDAEGVAWPDAIQLNDRNVNREHWYAHYPSIAAGDGGAVVAWYEEVAVPHKLAIVGIDGDFNPFDTNYVALGSFEGTYAPAHPDVVRHGSGYAVFYEGYVGDFQQILVQVVTAFGVPAGPPRALTLGPAAKSWPQAVPLTDGGYAMVYRVGSDIVYRRLGDDLATLGDPVTLLTGANPTWDGIAIATGTRNITRLVTSQTDDENVVIQQRTFNELGQFLCLDDAP